MAIRKVTSNKGKRTAGVDHMKWDTDAKKIEAICLLKRRGYKGLPAEEGQHSQSKWQDKIFGNTNHEGQSRAGYILWL
ncbi:reverse transcriptase N-terminal domain-containing protein [Bacteroides ovatus]|nr:reverse transcriptase N-terminal domain-containing protein [Bacteroides ovatus]